MKKHITTIDNILENNLEVDWEDLGFNASFVNAYVESIEAENDRPDFVLGISDDEVDDIIENCRKTGITEFTISREFPEMFEILEEFEKRGCVADGMVRINSRFERDHRTGERKCIFALLVEVCE